MGNLYRFVEPVVLLLLSKKGRSYGYDLSGYLPRKEVGSMSFICRQVIGPSMSSAATDGAA
jgi:hypothetical protein